MSWMFGYCDSGDIKDLLVVESQLDIEAMDLSAEYAEEHRFVSGTYPSMCKSELREAIVCDGWWFKDGEETKEVGFPYGENE